MTNQKFASGAFAFTRARGLQPRDPATLEPVAQRHGFDVTIIPKYAGDRAAVGRAIQATSSGLYREGFLLRPIKRTSTEVTYGIVREKKDEHAETLDHHHQATVTWKAEPDASTVEGDHPIARRVAGSYEKLHGKIVSEDWSGAITAFLEDHDATRVRDDGRIYWVPPQRVDDARRFGAFLAEVGIDLILAEIEPEVRTVVENVVHDNVEDQLDRLKAEVDQFDGKQKPSTYFRRLEEYQRLRERAMLYRDALGVGVDRTEQVLSELERKVGQMLDLRRKTVIHRNGTIEKSAISEKATESADETSETALGGPDSRETAVPPPTTLRFAGAEFNPAESEEPGVLVFVSSDEKAKNSVQTLESIGLTEKWQQAGTAEVSIQNSGPAGAEVSIKLRLPENQGLPGVAKSLASLGIELAS